MSWTCLLEPLGFKNRALQFAYTALLCIVLSGCFSTNSQKTLTPKLSKKQVETIQIEEQDGDDKAAITLAETLINQPDLFASSKLPASIQVKNEVAKALGDIQNERYVAAQNTLKILFRNESKIPSNVYVLAGDIELALENKEQALRHYQQALNNNKHNAKAANRLAKHMREQGNFKRAYTIYSQAMLSQPSHLESYRNRAVLNDLYLNNKVQALADYQAYDALLKYKLALHEGRVMTLNLLPVLSASLNDNKSDKNKQQGQAELPSPRENNKLNETPNAGGQINIHATQNSAKTAKTVKQQTLKDEDLKALKKDLKLVKRWLFDVGRQVESIAKVEASKQQQANQKGE